MNTKDYRTAAAVVTGARHLRTARNGQDAVMTIVDGGIGVAVVCDGCSAGTSSEVGARLGARLFAGELLAALDRGEPVGDERTWTAVRARVAAVVRRLVTVPILSGRDSDAVSGRDSDAVSGRDPDAVSGRDSDAVSGRDSDAVSGRDSDAVSGRDSDAVSGRDPDAVSGRDSDAVSGRDPDAVYAVSGRDADALDVIDLAMLREYFLFTIVAAAITRDGAAVWALGDGGFAIDGVMTRIGPFENNEPPYLAYDLLGDTYQRGYTRGNVGGDTGRGTRGDMGGHPRRSTWDGDPRRNTRGGSIDDPCELRDGASEAYFASVPGARTIVVATDGAVELVDALPALEGNVACFGAARYLAHPDALRRDLTRFARADERIDWCAQRVVRTPALLQDDCAIAVLQRDAVLRREDT